MGILTHRVTASPRHRVFPPPPPPPPPPSPPSPPPPPSPPSPPPPPSPPLLMQRILKHGPGWRLGWNPQANDYQGLVGTDDWALELTQAELDDFCRLLGQLFQTMSQMANELMDEEKIACEAESDLLWMEVEGYPHAYTLHLILHTGRRCEGHWVAEAIPGLVQAADSIKVF